MTEDVIKHLSFNKKPIPIPADYRPMYKIALIVLILKLCCRAEKGSLVKLHLFCWALQSEGNMVRLRDYTASHYKNDFIVWTVEPALNRALQYAVADNICELIGGDYKLTEKGEKFYAMIQKDDELLSSEKAFLKLMGKNTITDSRILSMSKQTRLFDA